jgi:hypothetical protein
MSSKFTVEEVIDLDIWQKFAETSLQYTIFVSSGYLQSFGGKFKTFFIKKGIETKASFCILLSDDEKNIILDELVIYSGILFQNDKFQKEVKARAERFEINEIIIEYITNTYYNIEISLTPQVDDMRPFLWHNYGSNNKKEIFSLDLRYTSYINISELKDMTSEEDTKLFKGLETLRQRNIRKARKENSTTVEELNIELFLEFYKDMMIKQDEIVSQDKLNNMANIIKSMVESKNALMLATKNSDEKIIYLIVFSLDKYRAYYLFGAGNPKATEKYKGTICFWDGFIKLANDYNIKEVDMEGVNSPARGWFKLSFGGELKPYYEIKLGE